METAGTPARDERPAVVAAGRRYAARASHVSGTLIRAGGSSLLDLMLPVTCPGCGTDQPLCSSCAAPWQLRPRRVRLDGTTLSALPGLPVVYAVAKYQGPVRSAIVAAKEHGRRDLRVLFGAVLAAAIGRLLAIAAIRSPLWLVPAPSRVSAARQRGGDPVTLACRSAAAHLTAVGVPAGVAPCLVTARGARDSVGLTDAQRAANLQHRVRWRPQGGPTQQTPVLLVDDVVTSGATLAVAAGVLRAHGHAVQAALTLAAAGGELVGSPSPAVVARAQRTSEWWY